VSQRDKLGAIGVAKAQQEMKVRMFSIRAQAKFKAF